jgi:hypothetical protein
MAVLSKLRDSRDGAPSASSSNTKSVGSVVDEVEAIPTASELRVAARLAMG